MNNSYRRASLRLCLLIMGTAILSPSASAQLPSRPDADAARYLRTAAEQSRPVVAAAEASARSLGAHSFIRKPASFDDVHAALRAALLIDKA